MSGAFRLSVLLAMLAAPGATADVLTTPGVDPEDANSAYDGTFTFVRLRFTAHGMAPGGGPPWSHDYPRAERNLMRILDEITLVAPRVDGTNIFAVENPELAKYPLAYICEPGYWHQTEQEVAALSAWLRKGGFLIVDDFRAGDIHNFQTEIRRVVPGAELVELDVSHPVFHSFFSIVSLEFSAPTFRRFQPAYYGIFENNDPRGRMLAVVNYNNDIGDYWEYSESGWLPVELSNEAYKLGVNYVVYAMTH